MHKDIVALLLSWPFEILQLRMRANISCVLSYEADKPKLDRIKRVLSSTHAALSCDNVPLDWENQRYNAMCLGLNIEL